MSHGSVRQVQRDSHTTDEETEYQEGIHLQAPWPGSSRAWEGTQAEPLNIGGWQPRAWKTQAAAVRAGLFQ